MKDLEFNRQYGCIGETKSDAEIKREILEKLLKRKEFQQHVSPDRSICEELNPDVIVISDDQSFLFEPQNQRALELLVFRCGLILDGLKLPERIRVHPLKSEKIINDLAHAGLKVAQEINS